MNKLYLFLLTVVVNACIDHPATDPRTFHCEVLDNGLSVLVIEDPKATESAAAMHVAAGFQNDPEGREGLAHFLEHMLFIATERYPEVDALSHFVSTRGGVYNAYTSWDHTQYFFSVKPEYFEEGLDIFTSFFVNPLFPEEYVERERHAVHSEFLMNKDNDRWREHQLDLVTRDSDHPLNRFHVGNLDTLQMSGLREALVDFYEAHYSSDNMYFVAVVPHHADQYLEMIKAQLNLVPKRFSTSGVVGSVFGEKAVGRWTEYRPIEDNHSLSISFPIPAQRDQYLSPATGYILRLLGDEGEGSIIGVLRQAGLANSLYAGASDESEEDGILYINIDLTEEGLAHQDRVMATVNAYIKLICSQGIQVYRFHEMQRTSYLHYLYYTQQSVVDQVNGFARLMPHYPWENLYRVNFVLDDSRFDRQHIHQILSKMVLSNARVVLSSPSVETNKVEPIYDIAYSTRPISEQQYHAWQQKIDFELSLPEKNPYIAEEVGLVVDTVYPVPQQVEGEWYYPSKHFSQPKTLVSAAISLPMAELVDVASAKLLGALLQEEALESLYPAILAGSSIQVQQDQYGLVLHTSGLGDKQELVMDKLESLLGAFKNISDAQYRRVKQKLLLDLDNEKYQRPFQYLIGKLRAVFSSDGYLEEDIIDVLQRQTVVGFRRYIESVVEEKQIRRFYSGNIVFDKPVSVVDVSLQQEGKILSAEEQTLNFMVEQDGYAGVVYYQMPGNTDKDHLMSVIIAQMIRPKMFEQLRTVEQMGYVVSCHPMALNGWPGINFFVQSPTVPSEDIYTRIKRFIEAEYTFDEAAFEGVKQGLLVDLHKPFETMSAEHFFYWHEIYTGKFDYGKKKRFADVLATIELSDVEAYFQDRIKNARKLILLANGEGEESKRAYTALKESL